MANRNETLQQRLDRIEKRAPHRKKRVIVVTPGPSRDQEPPADDAEDAPTDDSAPAHPEAE